MDELVEKLIHIKNYAQIFAAENPVNVIIILALAIILLLLVRFSNSYKNLKVLKADTDKSWENLKVLLNQRSNELPKLLKLCRDSFSKEDQEGMDKLISARKHISSATKNNDVGKLGIAEAMLRKELASIISKAKSYPDFFQGQPFKMMMARINGYNNAIGDRRELYNTSAKEINHRLSKRTGNMAASFLDVVKREEFNVQAEQLGTNDLSTLFAS